MIKNFLTKNRSCIQTIAMYDKSELDDRDFCLTLINENLIGVDPYYENLCDEMKRMIIKECRENIWYFLREVVRIPTNIDGVVEYVHLPLNVANVSAIHRCINSVDSYLMSPRQAHKDITFLAMALWFNRFKNQDVVIFNGSIQKAENIECMMHSIQIPDYLDIFSNRDNLVLYPKDTGILDELMQNEIQIYLDVNTVHYLEYVSDRVETKFKINKASMMESGNTCFRLYVYGGIHSYGVIKNINTDIDFENKMIDSLEDEGYIIGRDGKSVCLLKYTWKEIGLGEDWYKHMCSQLNDDPIAIAREIDLEFDR